VYRACSVEMLVRGIILRARSPLSKDRPEIYF
jgi:hypothetical protein